MDTSHSRHAPLDGRSTIIVPQARISHPTHGAQCPYVPQANTTPSYRNIDARCSLPQAYPPPLSVPKASGQPLFGFPHPPHHRDIYHRCPLPQANPSLPVGPQATVRPTFGPSSSPDSVPKALPKMVSPPGIPQPVPPTTTAGEDRPTASNCSTMGEQSHVAASVAILSQTYFYDLARRHRLM